jgi:flagellar basal-body rod protein FlgB
MGWHGSCLVFGALGLIEGSPGRWKALDFFIDKNIQAIGAYMSRLSQREQIISSNLANIETPNYKTMDVSFRATMQELLSGNSLNLQQPESGHLSGWNPIPMQAQPFEVQGLNSKVDGNNVDLDREMLNLSETTFGYAMISQILKGKFRTIALSINEGRG